VPWDNDETNLLVELFVEELPPKALQKLGDAFAQVLADSAAGPGAGHHGLGGDAVCIAAPAGRHTSAESGARRLTRPCRKS